MTDSPYEVRLSERAKKQLKKLEKATQARILIAAKLLATNPRPQKSRQLAGFDSLFRVRVGDYRIVYTIEDTELIVLVIQVGHRRDVYKF